MIKVKINGKEKSLPNSMTINELINFLNLKQGPVAIELNRQIIDQKYFTEKTVSEGDILEIVVFVGGG